MSAPQLKLAVDPEITSDAARYPAGTRWLWLDDAAKLIGCNEGTLRRDCLTKYAPEGLARKHRRPNGQEAWQIASIAHASLTASAPAEKPAADALQLAALSDAQRDQLAMREKVVTGWLEARRSAESLGLTDSQATARYLDQLARIGQTVGRATLYRWTNAYRAHGRSGLLDRRAAETGDAAVASTESVYRETLLRLWLDLRRRSTRLCHDLASHAAEEAGETPPGYKTAQRIVAAIDPGVVALRRFGSKAHTDRVEAYIDRDYSTIDANAWWCSDHHRLDVIVNAGTVEQPKLIRPWLHAWQDMRSRKIVGWSMVAHDPNADLILRVFASAARSHGVPEHIYIDNGKDFDAKALQGITKRSRLSGACPNALTPADRKRLGGAFGLLGAEVVHVWPYHGQSKPIERFFRTVKDRFAVCWDTYTGGTTAEKPEDLARRTGAGQAPLLADFAHAFGAWLEDDYHQRVHLGDSMHGQTPAQVYSACLTRRRTAPDELLAFACMPRVGPLLVRQNGVHWQGLSWGRSEPKLAGMFGQKVMLAVDVEDLDTAFVLDLDGRVICRARVNERLPQGADRQALRDAIAEKKSVERTRRKFVEDRPRMSLDVPELMLAAAAKRAEPNRQSAVATGTDSSPSISIVQIPFDGDRAQLRMSEPQAATVQPRPEQTTPAAALPSIFTYQRKREDADE